MAPAAMKTEGGTAEGRSGAVVGRETKAAEPPAVTGTESVAHVDDAVKRRTRSRRIEAAAAF